MQKFLNLKNILFLLPFIVIFICGYLLFLPACVIFLAGAAGTIAEIYEGKYRFADLTNREFVLNNYSPDNPNCKAENAENL